MDDLELYLDNDNTGMDIGGNSSPHNAMFYEDMDRGLLAVESMINLHETMRLSDKPTPEHINLFNLAVEQAYAVIDLQAPKSLSLESLTLTPRIAKESLLEDAKDAITAIGSKLGQFIKKTVDHLQYQLTLFSTQKNAIVDLRNILSNSSTHVSKDFRVSVNKYMVFGNNQVPKDFSEYNKEFTKVMKSMGAFLGAIDKFQKDDFFQSWKVFLSLVAGYNHKYNEQWDNLFNFINSTREGCDSRQVYKDKQIVEYRSDKFLGMSYIDCKLPAPGSYDNKFVDTKKSVHKHLSISIKRVEKFEIGLFDNKTELKGCDKRELIKMCDDALGTIHHVEEMTNFVNKLSTVGAAWVLSDATGIVLSGPIVWWVAILDSYRLMVRTSYLLLNNSASGFNFTRGNIDKFIRSTKKNISNA